MFLAGLYEAILQRIMAECPDVKYIDLYNDQYNNEEKENAFNSPAVLIEFPDFPLRSLGEGRQDADVPFFIHIGSEQYSEASSREPDAVRARALAHLTIVDSIQKALHLFGDGIGGTITRTSFRTSVNHNNLYVNIVGFNLRCVDDTSLRKYIQLGSTKPDMNLTETSN